jgi:hypothetical protein
MSKLINKCTEISSELYQLTGLQKGRDCALRALLNETDDLEIQFGSLYVKDSGKLSGFPKGFDNTFPWHMWVIDGDDNVYDCYDSIRESLIGNNFDCKDPSEWKIKLVDGTNFDCKKDLQYGPDKYRKLFDKWYKDYDAIFIYNYGFFHNPYSQRYDENGTGFIQYAAQLDWNMVEERILNPLEEILEGKQTLVDDSSMISITTNKHGKLHIKVN